MAQRSRPARKDLQSIKSTWRQRHSGGLSGPNLRYFDAQTGVPGNPGIARRPKARDGIRRRSERVKNFLPELERLQNCSCSQWKPKEQMVREKTQPGCARAGDTKCD